MIRVVRDWKKRLAIVDEQRFRWDRLWDFHTGDGTQLWDKLEDLLGERHITQRYLSYRDSGRGVWCSILHPADEMSPLAFIEPELEAEVLDHFKAACEGAEQLWYSAEVGPFRFMPVDEEEGWAACWVEFIG